MKVKHGRDHSRVEVAGRMVHPDSCHILPFTYRAKHDEPEEVHERKLAEIEERMHHWVEKGAEIQSLEGSSHEDASVKILDCVLQAWAPHDYRLVVVWDETVDGVTNRRRRDTHYDHPGRAPDSAAILATILQEARPRLQRVKGMDTHKNAVARLQEAHGPAKLQA